MNFLKVKKQIILYDVVNINLTMSIKHYLISSIHKLTENR